MNEKHNNATYNRPAGDRVIDAPSLTMNLPAFTRQIKDEDAWHKNDRNSLTVFKTSEMTIVLGGLRKDAEMSPRKAEGLMTLQVIEGTLEITTDLLDTTLYSGHLIVIHKGCNYRIVATEESIYLLTIANVRTQGA